ncbi:MAG: hypothetical protein UX87_C0006G0016 [Candidatus Amesbacteria bacterium GW2011_GWA1_47_16]|uniref:Uncharacterized protein n=3 Tax=Candidatus Amesiibacteriota TaxID=1752730 RepID=A0A0G1XU87_9BACT|nr:MAG: hypothetical protein UX87_C0006G0016 [Candidatus Amesbacteria bacterium GW2011_GWA1_47_16]KKU97880.1 MAG: hypothetical protein UY28_C0012G0044 [Candidatus Amesbacteria bacterium GW2011_GWB1_48_13]OGD00108.1 MAG: hypothetical protein A2972_01170 [Candidatus Amesbacteria bacterium RIFCSPLOWO2_01_FULL_47_33]OGD00824.1 MAG: hypothetical protein A2701_03920 [Candidatus Amesbacteria bacterium RIFCSPHIGHO2_01_FULL_47_34]
MSTKRKIDSLFLAAGAVIFAAAAVVLVFKQDLFNQTDKMVQTENTSVEAKYESVNDLVEELRQTEDDGGESELSELEKEASGL